MDKPTADRMASDRVRQRIIRFNPRLKDAISEAKVRPRILLLQGPVGPFFKTLQAHLEQNGYDVWRVCFNAGDRFYSSKKGRINFHGDIHEWRNWFHDFASTAGFDRVILFGAEREIHRVARNAAQRLGIDVLSLEEGYIRPGYITVEQGGNNSASPLAGRLPPPEMRYHDQPDFPAEDFKGFRPMCLHGFVYYSFRTFFTFGKRRELFHRPLSALPEIFYWLRNAGRRIHRHPHNTKTVEWLVKRCHKNYYLVPFQVDADAQMQDAALGWNRLRLISATLKSFAQNAPQESRLVFKVHPLERGHANHHALIDEMARAYGISDRVDILDHGSMGLLAHHAAGMITITSTSGLSAIHHGTPLLVLGEALYAHPELAVCAHGKPDFDAFWSCRHVADPTLRRAYLNWIMHEALAVGDYYARPGIHTACHSVLGRLKEHKSAVIDMAEARSAG
ncbi:MAG: hypothetical protein HKP10_02805 [Kiritimatiellales bacterium]|nr:hypothetical protein [Kiritimatiellales bacterium]